MCLCGTDVQYSYFVSPDRYQYRLQLSTDCKFCMQLGTPISMPTTRTPFIGWLYFIYQSIGQIISFQMMPPLWSFDDLDGKERGQKKTDDLRAMTTLGPRTLVPEILVWQKKSHHSSTRNWAMKFLQRHRVTNDVIMKYLSLKVAAAILRMSEIFNDGNG